MTSTTSNTKHVSSRVCGMHVGALEENPRSNTQALVIPDSKSSGTEVDGELGSWAKFPEESKGGQLYQMPSDGESPEPRARRKCCIHQRAWWHRGRKTLSQENRHYISEAKSRHSKILRNTLPDVFHVYFPFYLCTRGINGKIDV